MAATHIPCFAVIGMVNEGKTSVVATLSEDPKVTPNPMPGATVRCQRIPVVVNGQEILRFYDTPGFQNSVRALAWLRAQEKCQPPGTDLLALFLKMHAGNPKFASECELFRPVVEDHAGILYVVDGSAPITKDYRAEMEMLWMTRRPRMALINCKDPQEDYSEAWEFELGKFFNQTRHFNAHHATHHERLALLRSLQHMDGHQSWQKGFEEAIDVFEGRWEKRRVQAATTISQMLNECLSYVANANYRGDAELPVIKARLQRKYWQRVGRLERRAHEHLLEIYAHPVKLEELEHLRLDLFNETTWQTFGMTRWQLVTVGAAAGAGAGSVVDLATLGHSLGLGTLIGGASGAVSAFTGGKRLGEVQFDIPGAKKLPAWLRPNGKLGGQQIQARCRSRDFIFVLLNRALLLYAALVNRAHAQRGNIELKTLGTQLPRYTDSWSKGAKDVCLRYAATRTEGRSGLRLNEDLASIEHALFEQVKSALQELTSNEDQGAGG